MSTAAVFLREIHWYSFLHSEKVVVHVEGKKNQADKSRGAIFADLSFCLYLRTYSSLPFHPFSMHQQSAIENRVDERQLLYSIIHV